jgi:anthranilate synthase
MLSLREDLLQSVKYRTAGHVEVTRTTHPLAVEQATEPIRLKLDRHKGVLLSSGVEYPGRYSRWDLGFVDPPLELRARGRCFSVRALHERGQVLLAAIRAQLAGMKEICLLSEEEDSLEGEVVLAEDTFFYEEERTRRPSVFSVLRAIRDLFASPEDRFLGLYGAFGYDLVFQLEPVSLKQKRRPDQDDLVLYLPDELVVVDRRLNRAFRLSYDFAYGGRSTAELPRSGVRVNLPGKHPRKVGDFIFHHRTVASDEGGVPEFPTSPTFPNATGSPPVYRPGRYARLVEKARAEFQCGNLFEVVASHTLVKPVSALPSELFARLARENPSPYGFFINLGEEWLVGASPEMFVRVEKRRVETCPISGTIRRGRNAVEDAERIRELLNSAKDEAELTMCTDVDRNDKSRICVPGSVKVIGRRQLELYSRLIHTVDHVEGILHSRYDALDAFISHMWAVTVTGAPKRAALAWIEEHEESPRLWYGGAVGWIGFNGDLNTGLTLRTIHVKNGLAHVRVGATLLHDSVPEEEERETLTKAAALLAVLREESESRVKPTVVRVVSAKAKRVLLVDHEDSFVHTLGSYFRQCGADVSTLRAEPARVCLQKRDFDLVVLSPGPGKPEAFRMSETIRLCLERKVPVFGVCLGLQGMVEYFGGKVAEMAEPLHGKKAEVSVTGKSLLFEGVPDRFRAGLYHSLHAASVPQELVVTARSERGMVMAVQHKTLPLWAVQFHPESILTGEEEIGLVLVRNVLVHLAK